MDVNGVSIVIPAFNEAHRLPATLDMLFDAVTSSDDQWEIIVSDDGSTDTTVEVARRRADRAPVRVLTSSTNRGKGAALAAGVRAATMPTVVFLDADLPVSVDTIVALCRAADAADLVLGSRRLPGSSFDPPQPLTRRVGGRAFRLAVAGLGYRITSDPQCGAKAFNRDRVVGVLDDIRCERFGFDVELIARAQAAGLSIAEMPVAWRHVDGSSLRPMRDAVSTISELARSRRHLG